MFQLERQRLLELLSALASDDWLRPTPCPGWSVLGLSAHLLGDDLAWIARHRDGHHGTARPALDEAGFAVWLDDLQREWVSAARRLSPRLIVELLAWSWPQVVDVMALQDPGAIEGHVSWAGPDPVPVWLDQTREVAEQWIHRQQLLESLNRVSDLREDLAGPVLDGLRWAYRYRLSALPGSTGDTVQISITGELVRMWLLVRSDQGWDFSSDEGSQVVATMTMTAEQAWRLLTNNLRPEAQAAIATTGEAAITSALRRTRAIVGVPK